MLVVLTVYRKSESILVYTEPSELAKASVNLLVVDSIKFRCPLPCLFGCGVSFPVFSPFVLFHVMALSCLSLKNIKSKAVCINLFDS